MSGNTLVQSVLRTLDILELIGNSPHGVNTKVLCNWLTMKRPAAHNVLKSMVHKRFLEKTRGRPNMYRLGPAILELRRLNRDRELFMRAGAFLLRICRQFGVEVLFTEYLGGGGFALLRASPQRPGVLEVPTSYHIRPYGLGLIYQAFLSREERQVYRKRHPFGKWRDPEVKTLRQIDQIIAQARRIGYVVLGNRRRTDMYKVAAPIFGSDNSMVAAICMFKRCSELTREQRNQCREAICQAAAELSYKPNAPLRQSRYPTAIGAIRKGGASV